MRSARGLVLGALLLGACGVAMAAAQQAASAGARVQSGLFTVRSSGDRVVFEIPARALDQEMVIQGSGVGRLVRWRRTPDGIVVEEQGGKQFRATLKGENAGNDGAIGVDVTSLFTAELLAASGIAKVPPGGMRVAEVEVYPTNVKIVVRQARPDAAAQAMEIHYNVVQLPKTPILGRLSDPRVDIDAISAGDAASDRRFVQRVRLEKRDPSAAVSDVVRPIVFVIDPTMPKWLVTHVKNGVAEWLPAFEAAGFRNALVTREAPDSAEDPTWGLDDARYSVIRWDTTTPYGPAGGPDVIDPRSGEILRGSVNVPSVYLQRMLQRYFVYAGPLDPRIQHYPDVPDELTGRLFERVIAHEVGHVFGLPQYDSWSTYPIDSLRSAGFLQRVGRHVPTVMGLQYNDIAQPEDSVPPDLLTAMVGPYDYDAVAWQMTPIVGARTPDDEVPTLRAWIEARDKSRWHRFTNRDAMRSASDASAYDDAVRATTLGMRNLERAVALIRVRARMIDYDGGRIAGLYDAALQQWRQHQLHVIELIGGVRYPDGFGMPRRAEPLAAERQRAAAAYLKQYAFDVPAGFLDPFLLRFIEGGEDAPLNGFRAVQTELLGALLSPSRLQRLAQQEQAAGPRAKPYAARELLADVRRGVWRELDTKQPVIDAYRRGVQLVYLETLARLVALPDTQTTGAASALARGELVALRQQIARAAAQTADQATRSHLDGVQKRIREALDVPRS